LKSFFFETKATNCGVQLIEGSTIFDTSFNVLCSRAVNFESKLILNPGGIEALNNLENAEEYVLFFLKMMLDCLESVY
jgi:hypothetical protein